MSVFDGKHVIAVNANGDKQEIPAHWLDHPVLGKGFTKTPSQKRLANPVARKPRNPVRRGGSEGGRNA